MTGVPAGVEDGVQDGDKRAFKDDIRGAVQTILTIGNEFFPVVVNTVYDTAFPSAHRTLERGECVYPYLIFYLIATHGRLR